MSISNLYYLVGFISVFTLTFVVLLKLIHQSKQHFKQQIHLEQLFQHYHHIEQLTQQTSSNIQERFTQVQNNLTQVLYEGQLNGLKHLQSSVELTLSSIRTQFQDTLTRHSQSINEQIEKLTFKTEEQLKQISGQVEQRLSNGFEKTNETFQQVINRLLLIDEAQKKIAELSNNVINLKSILTDKPARGAFGEVQLSALLHNTLPENSFSLQHHLSNGKRVDCMLFLPEPTGHIAIDAKFPLESYQRSTSAEISDNERRQHQNQFRKDIRKHIQDIAEKYIIPHETADGAILFIPAEAVFAEIHANYPDLVATAQRARVWLVSPTTLMAILTTARAVIKDTATRQQIHLIQVHLTELAKDFGRFEKRMQQLSRHIEQAHQDVTDVNTSAQKILKRFQTIESTEITPLLPAEPILNTEA